jgi:PAT family beta-lactamase induction signal transducer AmpG
MEVLIGVNILLMAYVDPIQSTLNLAVLAFTLSFFSASHDVAIDAWRIEIHKKSELGLGAAMYVTGYRISLLVAGAGALVIADLYSWKLAFIILASFFPLGILIVGFCNIKENTFNEYKERKSYKSIFTTRVIDPFLDFMRKNNWVLILVFIALFKWGDALLGVLSQPFMLEIGFTKSEIAAVSKVYGLIATLVGLFIGGIIISRLGIIKSLLIAGILQLLSNLVFISLAINGSSIPLLMSTITIENLSGGIGTAAFIAYLSSLCNIRFSAFQYALLSSFMAFSRTWLAAPAGWLIDSVSWIKYLKLIGLYKVNNPEWVGFFIITTLFAIPSLILIYYIKDNKK